MRRISGIAFLFFGMFVVPSFAQRYATFPQFANGLGWTSEMFFANQGLSSVDGIVISFYDNDGNAMSVQTNLFTGTSYTFDLAKGVTLRIKAAPGASFQEGYVVIEYPSTGSEVRASEIYSYVQDGRVVAEVGVPQQEQGEHFSFAIEESSADGIQTAVALANPVDYNYGDEITQTIILNLVKQDGTVQATATKTLQPGKHTADYISEIFPGLGDFVGTLSVSSPLSVSVLALRQEKEAFGAISTDGGPILAPFEASGLNTTESENNNDFGSADVITNTRPLSLLVHGIISYDGDEDFYRFQGHAGDIISVICRRDENFDYNYLDPIIEIFDPSQELIGYNDQNGISPQGYPLNDSFIQMQLPSNGTYYIRVLDYYGYGDANSVYWLDIKLP